MYLFEVKNHNGDYFYDSGKFYNNKSNTENINPLHQLKRKETLLHQLLLKLGYNLPINGSVIFIHPEFISATPHQSHYLPDADSSVFKTTEN
ncbi:nuclease-related domain-containing protein [Virgibacillus oceani]